MFSGRQLAGRLLAVGVGCCIALACIGSGVAVAAPSISVTNFAWSGGGKCPEKEGKVHFTVVGQWCEYLVKNEAMEESEITELLQTHNEVCNFGEGVLCLNFKVPAELECKVKLMLAAGGRCYIRLEYRKKPTEKSQMSLIVVVESDGLEVGNTKSQTVE